MIELIQEYWRPFLYSDGEQLTGLAMTLWLTSLSLCLGFIAALPLSIARVACRRRLRWPVQCFTYLFRGSPLYIQLLIC
jgi:histidine transport system permease protein